MSKKAFSTSDYFIIYLFLSDETVYYSRCWRFLITFCVFILFYILNVLLKIPTSTLRQGDTNILNPLGFLVDDI